jgi:hypothetical protein
VRTKDANRAPRQSTEPRRSRIGWLSARDDPTAGRRSPRRRLVHASAPPPTAAVIHPAPGAAPLLGTFWHDTDLTLPHAIVEVLAAAQLTARVAVRTGPHAGEQLEIPAAQLGRRYIPVLHHR